MSEELEEFVNNSSEDETVETSPETETDAPTASEPTEESHEPEMVPLAAKQAEKQKRQEAEQRNRELERLLQSQNQQSKPDIFENPEQVLGSLEMKLKAEMSEALVKDAHADYDDVMDHYEDMVRQNPAIHAEIMRSALPARQAYNMAKDDLLMKEIGDPSTYRERLKAEILAELEGKKATPPDLTTARSSGDNVTASMVRDVNDIDLTELLGR